LPGTFFERTIVSCNLAEVSLSRLRYPDNLPDLSLSPLRYPANLAGGPAALIFFASFSFIKERPSAEGGEVFRVLFFGRIIISRNLAEVSLFRLKYPANLAGIPDALIFFCLLFLHQGKKRRKDPSNSNTVSPI